MNKEYRHIFEYERDSQGNILVSLDREISNKDTHEGLNKWFIEQFKHALCDRCRPIVDPIKAKEHLDSKFFKGACDLFDKLNKE